MKSLVECGSLEVSREGKKRVEDQLQLGSTDARHEEGKLTIDPPVTGLVHRRTVVSVMKSRREDEG